MTRLLLGLPELLGDRCNRSEETEDRFPGDVDVLLIRMASIRFANSKNAVSTFRFNLALVSTAWTICNAGCDCVLLAAVVELSAAIGIEGIF